MHWQLSRHTICVYLMVSTVVYVNGELANVIHSLCSLQMPLMLAVDICMSLLSCCNPNVLHSLATSYIMLLLIIRSSAAADIVVLCFDGDKKLSCRRHSVL